VVFIPHTLTVRFILGTLLRYISHNDYRRLHRIAGALLDDYCQATAAVKLDDFSQKVCLLQPINIRVQKRGDQFRFKPWNIRVQKWGDQFRFKPKMGRPVPV
jgi:hypothetical protein